MALKAVDTMLNDVRSALRLPFRLYASASACAHSLFLLRGVKGLRDDLRVVGLLEEFHRKLRAEDRHDVLPHQVEYASKLAAASGELIYEEMHKLFSLCDEVHALRSLGFALPQEAEEQFVSLLRTRFKRQNEMAAMVAEDRMNQWNHSLWWYAENLKS